MILLETNRVTIEDLEQILVIEPQRVRCLLKQSVLEVKGNHFHVVSLSDHELIVEGKCRSVELNER